MQQDKSGVARPELLGMAAVIGTLAIVGIMMATGEAYGHGPDPRSEAIILSESPYRGPIGLPRGMSPLLSSPQVVIPIPLHGDPTDDGTVGQYLDWENLHSQRLVGALLRTLSDIQFAFDSSIIEEQYNFLISEVAQVLAINPEIHLAIEGHTDLVGGIGYNDLLGQRRADAVRAALILSGVAAHRVTTVTFGKSRPLVADLGRLRKNRRVEVIPEIRMQENPADY